MRFARKYLWKLALVGLVLWIVPCAFLLKFGFIRYDAYAADGVHRFVRTLGPMVHSEREQEKWVRSDQIPLACRASLVAAEDTRFYTHIGIDPRNLWQALRRDLRAGRIVWGGSSITQQLVKNLFLGREKTVFRKVREILGALLLDRVMTKQDQITWYLNAAEFGPNLYGIGAAAQNYFSVPPERLTLANCVELVSLLPDPVRSSRLLLNPGRQQTSKQIDGELNYAGAQRRHRAVLRVLARTSTIDQAAIDDAARDLNLRPEKI